MKEENITREKYCVKCPQKQKCSKCFNDKIIWYFLFILIFLLLVCCAFLIKYNEILRNQNRKEIEKLMNEVMAYITFATEDEYNQIVQTLRYDLVFSEYADEIENALKYIPNTAEQCPTCQEHYQAQAYLICSNTGKLYVLDLIEEGKNLESSYGGTSVSFAYDEISDTSVHILKSPGQKDGTAVVYRGNGIVSLHKMKAIFCDNCLEKILQTIQGQSVSEILVFDALEKVFYSLGRNDRIRIGNYILEIDGENYKIKITCADDE